MSETIFNAMVVREGLNKTFSRSIEERKISELPDGETTIRVSHSSLNYKDALSAVGNRGVTKSYPHTPGIDAAGEVVESTSPDFKPGDRVLVTGYDLGMNTPGGFGQYIRVPGKWVVPIPENLTNEQTMAYGTAGLTAALSVFHLKNRGVAPEDGPILVTGATGGVGSLAVSFLSKAGYEVTAVSGKPDAESFLRERGARSVIRRDALADDAKRPLLKAQWAGAVDTVGGNMLAAAIKSTKLHGSVACCGNVGSGDLPLTVYPFILRGVSLLGVDSQNCQMDVRLRLWEKMAGKWKIDDIDRLTTKISLEELNSHIDEILKGSKKGRTVVDMQ